MRVLHFFKTAYPITIGGIEMVIHQLASKTSRMGVDTQVLALAPDRHPSTERIDGYTLHRLPLSFSLASTSFGLSAFSRFAQLAAAADILHYHFPWPFMDVVHFATRPDKPSLVTYHSDIVRQRLLLRLYSPLRDRFLASVDQIVATSPNYVASSDVLRRFSDKISVIPIGLDKDAYPTPDAERLGYWRERITGKFFLFVGVLRYYKGLHVLLRAARSLRCAIVIAGSGPNESELRRQASALGVGNVHFLGQISEVDKAALLTLCYGVVLPSHLKSEAFGISLLEGAMYGKPMVCCEIGTGTSYINVDQQTGLVVAPEDPDALHQAMRHLCEHHDAAQAMGAAAQQRYRELFTADTMAASYLQLYEKLSEKQCRPPTTA